MGKSFSIGDTMKKKIVDKKQILLLTILCCAVYFASYVTRLSFAAVLVEIISNEGYTKSAIAIVTTALFITYGAGQLISGVMGDRLDPKYIIFYGLLTSVAMNLLIPFCPSTGIMASVWAVNGFAQAMIWPPLVKILTNYMSNEQYKKASVRVSIASSAGTVAIYLLSPLFITIYGWRLVFYFVAGLAAAVAVVWLVGSKKIDRYAEEFGTEPETEYVYEMDKPKERKLPFGKIVMPAGLLFIMLAIIFQGSLRDGVTTWMPTYIVDTFHLASSTSILTAVIMPIFSIISFKITAYIHTRWLHNEVACGGAMLFSGFLASLILMFTFSQSVALSVFLSALITGGMHGANLMLVCMVPARLAKYGKASTASGVLNSCTYIGSALSTYGIALVAERFGWGATIGLWAVIALVGTLACIFSFRRWQRFLGEQR